MLKLSISRAVVILLSSTLVFTSVACNKQRQILEHSNNVPATKVNIPIAATETATTSPAASVEPRQVNSALNQLSYFDLALDKAAAAVSISQSAQSSDDWNLVASQWQEAIALMKSVPTASSEQAIAKIKIVEYQRHLKYATQQANHPTPANDNVVDVIPETPSLASSTQTKRQKVFQAKIIRRFSGIPVINVTFNRTQKIEMVVDTGASGTVLTQKDATLLGVVPVAKAKASTASAKSVEFPVGYVDSIEIGGAVVKDIPVVISGPELEIGLLGHDFFSNYDVTIKRDVVEFRSR